MQKKIICGTVASLRFCCFRQRVTQNGRLLFFLEEKKQKKIICGAVASLRFCCFRQRAAQNGRLLFFLEEKKQKKIICGTVASLRFCGSRQRAAQNGRFTYEPSVFMLQAECAGKHLFSDRKPPPQCLLFLFFKKRKRTLLKKRNRSPFRKIENVPPLEKKKSIPIQKPFCAVVRPIRRTYRQEQ